jgi:hypothetical protein
MTFPQQTQALKEWQVAIDALTTGQTILLLRKGGIKEAEGKFTVKAREVILYPTTEHQKPELLKPQYRKPQYREQANAIEPDWHPETIMIKSWAQITDVWSISDPETVEKLMPYHIWNEQFVRDRLQWKPRQPLYLLLLRVYRLTPQSITYDRDYGGCRSWITLKSAISLENSNLVLTDDDYLKLVQKIKSI